MAEQAICHPKHIWNFLFSHHCAFFQVGLDYYKLLKSTTFFCYFSLLLPYVWWNGLVVFCAYYSMGSWLSVQGTTSSGTCGRLLPICLLFRLAASQITVMHVCPKSISYHSVFFLLITIFCKLRIIFFLLKFLVLFFSLHPSIFIYPYGTSNHIYLKAYNLLCYSECFALDLVAHWKKLLLVRSSMSTKM